ncbi:MAG TPA: hypothetical protein VN726_21250 [Hanamia sp.]|nr:hypothetical protein [Hanamia sp.]
MKKQQARNLYFQTDLTQTRIAELLDVDRKTIYLWIKEGHWASIKKSAQHTPSILAEQYYQQLLAINQVIAAREQQPYPTMEEAEIIRKLTLTIKHIKNGQTVGETVEVLMNFIHQITKTDLNLAKEILPHADKYIRAQENPPIIKPTEAEEPQEEEEEIEEHHNSNPNQMGHCELRSNLSQHDPNGQNITDENDSLIPTGKNTGDNWGTNGQSFLTHKQAETLAAQHLWDTFKAKFTQNSYLEENGKKENKM